MGVIYNDSEVRLEGIVDEKEVKPLREHLQKCSPLKVNINLAECNDIHTAVIQLLVSYHLMYGCEFIYPHKELAFVCALKGAHMCDNNINQ